jgi:thiamine pyrophosphate-dependent enzyme
MRGRQILMESLIAQGVSYIFGNPGTTESPIIDSLLDYPQTPTSSRSTRAWPWARPATTRRPAAGRAS